MLFLEARIAPGVLPSPGTRSCSVARERVNPHADVQRIGTQVGRAEAPELVGRRRFIGHGRHSKMWLVPLVLRARLGWVAAFVRKSPLTRRSAAQYVESDARTAQRGGWSGDGRYGSRRRRGGTAGKRRALPHARAILLRRLLGNRRAASLHPSGVFRAPADAPAAGSEIGKTRWEVPYLEPDEEAWREHRATLEAHLPSVISRSRGRRPTALSATCGGPRNVGGHAPARTFSAPWSRSLRGSIHRGRIDRCCRMPSP